MIKNKGSIKNPDDREIVITRIIDASPERVWQAFTDPEQVAVWWGPNGFTNTILEMNVKPGGVWKFIMHGPDGRNYNNKITFIEVLKPKRLVYEHGGEVHEEPFHGTITFDKHDNKTKVTLQLTLKDAQEKQRLVKFGAVEGGNQTLGRLEKFLAVQPSENEIVITRVFNAPRIIVWRAWTESEQIAKWFGPQGFNTRVEENDLRIGGRIRYVMIGPDKKEYPSEGTVLEIIEFEKIVTTDEFGEGFTYDKELPQGMISTVFFDDLGHKTKVTIKVSHPTAEDKRKHEAMGVVAGWNSSLDCLEETLAQSANEKMSNKDIATTFLKTVVARRIKEAYEKYVDMHMRHHNAYFPGDAKSMEKAMEENHAKFPNTTIDIKHVLADGNMVAVHSHVKMSPEDLGYAVVHIFRFENGKIIEMWDLGQEILKDSPNKNGMF